MEQSKPSNAACALALAALTAFALSLRLWTLDFGLPYSQEPDPHILGQIETLSQPVVTDEELFFSSIYPHFLARSALLFGAPVGPPEGLAELDLAGHLAAAGRLHLHVRALIACLSILIVPATFWLASYFMARRWALAAAGLAALSTLSLQFGQQARPHAAVAPLIVLAVAGCVHLRRRGDTRAFVIAGALCAVALACLTNAFAVLLPAGLAYLLRNGARRRILDSRLLIPLAMLALAVRIYYPFFFVDTPPGAVMPTEEGTLSFGWQTVNWSEFQGAGFPTLFMTLWYYEPVASLLALAGLAAWLLRRGDGSPESRERRKDLLVALSFALSYALVIGLQRRNQQRFVLPLVPYVCAAAGYGLAALFAQPKLRLARWFALASLAVPLWACIGYSRMRSRPHTLEQLGAWIEANVERGTQRVGLHLLWDVPLARRHANLFDASGAARKVALSPWLRYQAEQLDRVWQGERWDLEPLYPERERWPQIVKDPFGYLGALAADYVVLPAGEGVGVTPLTRALRAELERRGERVLTLPAEERPSSSGLEGLDTPHFTRFVSTATWFGPQLEVFRLPRER